MKANECEGCIIYLPEFEACAAVNKPVKYIKWCPCRTCLIKPMCNRVCEEYTNNVME